MNELSNGQTVPCGSRSGCSGLRPRRGCARPSHRRAIPAGAERAPWPLTVDDPAPQQLAVVGRQRVDLVPSESRATAKNRPSWTQKSRLKRRLRSAASCSSARRSQGLATRGQAAPRSLGVVGVALQLARGRGTASARVVRDRVPGVLQHWFSSPVSSLRCAGRRCSRCPAGRRTRRSIRAAGPRTRVRGPAWCHRSSARTRRAVRRTAAWHRRAVVGRVRLLLERRHLAVTHLVQDPARILLAEVVERGPASASARRVVAASSGANGSACRLVKMLSGRTWS